MKLVSFTIRNYRSIINAKKINVGKKTILVGPNNEGKSNILRALATAMKVLTRKGVMSDFPGENMRYFYEEKPYRWETDFPISLQSTQPKGATEIVLEFQPTADELIELQETIGSEPTGNIPLRI
ncbi:MAG: AAA family ATPase, partial [Planctomycetota bacterium]